jgi:hypothetical protein
MFYFEKVGNFSAGICLQILGDGWSQAGVASR